MQQNKFNMEKYLKPYWQKVFAEYDQIFAAAKKNGTTPGISVAWKWNWAAFFFGLFWMLYKKQWLMALFLVPFGYFTFGAIYALAGGLTGNFYEYCQHRTGKHFYWSIKGAIEEIMKTFDPDDVTPIDSSSDKSLAV